MTVIDAGGVPMPNCEVSARLGGVSDEAEWLRTSARTDATGVAWLSAPKGQLRVSVRCGRRGHGELDLGLTSGVLEIETDYYEFKRLLGERVE